jgi:hypothetical protein
MTRIAVQIALACALVISPGFGAKKDKDHNDAFVRAMPARTTSPRKCVINW